MSIASELNNYRNGLEDAYDAVSDMSGTIPTDRNMNNLDDAIRTIPISSPNDGVLTITQNGTTIQTFSANQATNATAALTDTTYSDFTGATSSTAGAHGLVPAPAAGDEGKALLGDGTWGDATAKLVEMSYGESNAWAKFIAAYNAGSIVYCRASSNANPATGSQTRKAFMAYVNNATSPTSVEFQYVRSNSSKSDSSQCDQVFVYTLKNTSGGQWSVATRDMAPKINVSGPITKTFTNGANATITIGADTMTGATSGAAGAAGVVPKPNSGDQDKFLKGDGTWANIFDLIYPVGSIYMSVNNTDPGTLFGGTWTAWGSGRVPVGVDTTQTEFDTVEETGGEKTHTLTVDEIPSHRHYLGQMYDGYHLTGSTSQPRGVYADYAQSVPTTATGGDEAHNNLQPYITCYMWKRTA